MKWEQKQKGFTIVELLIIVVVIAILATITIVGYNTIQLKANNTRTVAAAKEVIKLLQLYKTQQGAYPSGFNYACVGEYSGGVCQFMNGDTPEVIEVASFKAAISIVGSMPQPTLTLFSLNNNRVGGGVFYRVAQQDVTYYLNGLNQECVAGGVAGSNNTATSCIYKLP